MVGLDNVYLALDVFILIIVNHVLNTRVKRKLYFESCPIWTFERRKFEFEIFGSKFVKLASLQVKSAQAESHPCNPSITPYKGSSTSSSKVPIYTLSRRKFWAS